MSPHSVLLSSAAAILLSACVASPTGQARGSGAGCPMNFKPYCEVSRHRSEAPDPHQCRCVRISHITGMPGGND